MVSSPHSGLQELGLSEYESTVYLALLKLGATTTGPVIDETRLHRQFVYTALQRLTEKGLCSHVTRRNRKLFSPSHPSLLLQLQQQRLLQAQELIPALLNLQEQRSDELQIRVLRGSEEFHNNLMTMIESAARSDQIMRIIGGAPDTIFYETIGKRYAAYEAACQKARVKKHLLAPENASEQFKKKFAAQKGNVLKLVARGLSSPSYTRITPELTSIEIYLSDVVIIQIWSKDVALGYLEHFNLLWNSGQHYRPQGS